MCRGPGRYRWPVSRLGAIHTSIVGKAAVAVVAFALALTAVAWVAVRATDDATKGAAAVQREFAERVAADIVDGLNRGAHTVWSPRVLRPAFALIRAIPRPLWRRLKD